MPFGLNIIKILDQKGYNIDVYLSEYKNDAYKELFSKNVTVHFINQNYLWRNQVPLAYFMVTTFFKLKSFFQLRNKYELIFGTGMAGITLAAILKRFNKQGKFIYLNDEFPAQVTRSIWVDSEIKYAVQSDVVVIPDETRLEPLCKQIPGLNKIQHFTLPNAPLMDEIKDTPQIDWHDYFNLTKNKHLFLTAGGISETYLISDLISSVRNWPKNCVLIVKSKNSNDDLKNKYPELNLSENIILCNENLSSKKLHSLIKYCTASIGLYRNENDNVYYVGKSSGKIMRSLALGKPVIASNFPSLNFIKEMNLGKLVSDPGEIGKAVEYILENQEKLMANCIENYPTISFEKYWTIFKKNLI